VASYISVLMGGLAERYMANFRVRYWAQGLCLYILGRVLRNWARTKEDILQNMVMFHVESTACTCEDDRPLVYDNIARFMRATREVEQYATEEHALAAFNRKVRTTLPNALEVSVGPFGMRYAHVVAIFLTTFWPDRLDRFVSGPPRFELCWSIDSLIWVFGVFPLLVASLCVWCGLCLRIRGLWEQLFIILGVMCVSGCARLLETFTSEVVNRAISSASQDWYLVLLIFLFLLLTFGAFTTFRCLDRKVADEVEDSQLSPTPSIVIECSPSELASRSTLTLE